MLKITSALTAGFALALIACAPIEKPARSAEGQAAPQASDRVYYAGADLSWVNELEDCGAEYRKDGELGDPYEILADAGMNMVRIRIWKDPVRTDYSTLHDAARSLRRAKKLGLMTMLDFHYSDDWADPGKQTIPAAWADDIDNVEALSQHVYDYTVEVLTYLGDLGLMPEIVQVGNEINTEILRPKDTKGYPINWPRNAALINAGIRGVRAIAGKYGVTPRVMLHIAQPENVEPWFADAARHGVTDFDFIGISYYPYWSEQSVPQLGETIQRLRGTYDAEVIVVETGYPWTLGDLAVRNPERAARSAEPGYPISVEGQRKFLLDLSRTVLHSGGVGVFTWEPAAVTTRCSPWYGQEGNRWSSALFDYRNGNELLPGAEYLDYVASGGRVR